MLKLNQIYKVKEGHKEKCYNYWRNNGRLGESKDTIYYGCSCFTEDDLELEEECTYCEGLGFRTISVENENGGGDIEREICPKCNGKSKPEEEVKEKSLEDLEVGDEVIDKDDNVYQIVGAHSHITIKTPEGKLLNYNLDDLKEKGYKYLDPEITRLLSPSEAETLLEERLGIKVKIKN